MITVSIAIQEEVSRYSDEIRKLRRTIHRHPELGNREFCTADLVESQLRMHGINTERVCGTAVIGTLEGAYEGKTVALRADMDALPVQEETACDFASEVEGVMHACGHDVHTAALLGAAAVLSDHRSELKGKVVFLFQPDEEGSGGAQRMIEAGCMDGVDAVFGAHVCPDLPEGHAGFRCGKFYAASDMFTVRVFGRSSHGAVREDGTDALGAAAEMVTSLLGLPGRLTSDKAVLTVGRLQSGTAGNIMPGYAEFEGIIRTLGPETRLAMEEAFRETVSEIASKTGTETEIIYRNSYPGIVNDDDMTLFAADSGAALLGPDRVHFIEKPVMTTEDFGYYLMEVPGTFWHMGAGCSLPLHNPGFLPAESTACDMAAMHVRIAADFLGIESE